jgi:flagellar hook assembly protein FlgD
MPAPSGVTLSYTLSLDSSVSVEVRTLSGMMVRRIASGRPGTMGTNLVTWDGNDQNGRRAANGPYLVVITALNGDGQMVKQSRTVTLVR